MSQPEDGDSMVLRNVSILPQHHITEDLDLNCTTSVEMWRGNVKIDIFHCLQLIQNIFQCKDSVIT